jgi:RNA polymerase sigma-70 factor (ECF subfamily)
MWRRSLPRSANFFISFSLRAIVGKPASSLQKMNVASSALAPARPLSDLLSSGTGATDKSKRKAMDQARSDEDQQLVARTQAGDPAAFDQLVVKYTPRLYGLVYNMTSNHEDTNDLLQDVFAKAYKAIRGFRGKSSFYTWIHSIAVNMTLNFLKKRGRRYHLSLDDVDASIQNDKEFLELTATSSPVREADLAELQRRLNEAMMKLSDEHRAVVTMFHVQGMPHAEISKILKVSEGTVRSRLFYANRQLQNYLDEFRKNPVS